MTEIERLSELFKLIKHFEGCRLRAYLCPSGVWTVGFGSTGADVGPGTVWTQGQADRRMEQDAIRFARRTLAILPELAHDDGGLCALADLGYNAGTGVLRRFRDDVAAFDWPAVRARLGRYIKGGGRVLRGLVIRRAAEAELLPV